MDTLQAISPIDGRYQKLTGGLSPYFSEQGLMKYRLWVETEYFIALSLEEKVKELPSVSDENQKTLRALVQNFSLDDAKKIKEIEKTTNHDVKSVEYFLKEKLPDDLKKYQEFIHFGLTSEDVNNLSFSLMLKAGLEKAIIPSIEKISESIKKIVKEGENVSLLSLTHGQPATPTTVGKEMAVFYSRLSRNLNDLKAVQLEGKLNGASGNYAALQVAYPEIDWIEFSKKFIESFGLKQNLLTTQIENHDCSCLIYDALSRLNSVIKDLDQDIWLYISRGIFKLKKKEGEIGSSTMPHKVNPINFENSEGNLGLANSLLRFLSDKLPISRMQRDLTDSTVLRNQGTALAYALIAYENTLKGLEKLEINKEKCQEELNEHWEVLAEAIQTVLRKVGHEKPYEKLKELTRGEKITAETIKNFINDLEIDPQEKEKLLNLTPNTYIGLSEKLSNFID